MFSITSGESCPRVKFRGLGKAAGYRSPGSSPQIEHRVVKIAHHFGLPSARFPPLCRLGKEGGAPASQWISNPQWECNTRSHILSIQTDADLHFISTTNGLCRCKVLVVPDNPQQNKEYHFFE